MNDLFRSICRLPWPNLLTLFLIVPLAIDYFSPFADLDYTWQIRTGERIVQTGRLSPPESFSYTVPGRPVDQVEWLYEVTLYAVWTTFGYGGLKLLRTLLVAATLLLLAWRLRREGVAPHGIILAVVAAIVTLCPFWNLRPLYCTTLGLLLVAGWLHDHCTGRRPLTWWLPVMMLLWGNAHPGVIVGQGLLLGAIAWEWLNRWVRLNPPLDRAACGRLTLIGGLGLAASLLGPNPLGRLLLPFSPEMRHPVMGIFEEMQPLYHFLLRPPYTVALAYPIAALVGLTVVLGFRRYRLWEVALLTGLAVLANAAVRSVPDWVLLNLALGVPHLAALVRRAEEQPERTARCWLLALRVNRFLRRELASPRLRFQWGWPAAALAVLALISLVPPLSRRMPIQDDPSWPKGALDWIEAQGLGGRFFSPPNYGSYVIWRLGDQGKCYVYTRGFCLPPELLEDSHYVPQLGPDWPARLERVLAHGTDYFLLETTGPRGQLWQSLRPHVGAPLYLDEQTVLLSAAQVRRALPLAFPSAIETAGR
ncbi:MAG TPA: hypothetical protein VNK04_15970 [Gemmataceae bacterium]|nr:hypothetical protein [Gemmataceae bacterium]